MKQRAGLILLLPTYLLLNLQLVLQVHSCQIRGVDVRLFAAAEDSCCTSWEEETPLPVGVHCTLEAPDCCETADISLHLEQPQQLTQALTLGLLQAQIPQAPTLPVAITLPVQRTWAAADLPPPAKVARWRYYCAALTYG